uniref:C2H2-type domain-containing protein n=1 Tax=Ditylenchus dipsaci TaxID=166011 RepID=A0A915DQH2_9BILA
MSIRTNSIVVVSGCTGTGKSDLGIEIAKAFDGEVISADSMQIYKGLDIVTNKVTREEMCGVPHHMMSFLDPRRDNYNVHEFRTASLELIADMWRRNKLPVIVGGTIYYVESILYQNYLINTDKKLSEETREMLDAAGTDELYQILCQVDPESALQIHRNNKPRVRRALEIFYSTGKRKSQHLSDQKCKASDRNHLGGSLHFKKTLLINLDAETGVLDERLNKRVGKMAEKGLREELEDFYSQHKESLESFGIGQSIGLKEFMPYLKLDDHERMSGNGRNLFKEGCELLKYRILSRAQTREVPKFINLNTSSDFHDVTVPFALNCVSNFLSEQEVISAEDLSLPHAALMELPDREHLSRLVDSDYERKSNLIHICECCQKELHGQKAWERHIKGKLHRANQQRQKTMNQVSRHFPLYLLI